MRRVNGRCSTRTTKTKTRYAALAATVLVATAEAIAQEKQSLRATRVAQGNEQPARRIVISIPDRKLALVEGERVVKVYPVAVGAAANPSPAGEFKIANRTPQPAYYAPGTIIPPGKDNPLGTRWLGLTQRGLGIHGTNQPRSIGRRASHGCIRMRNRDIEELFELVRTGDVVELHTERTAELAEIFGGARGPSTVASGNAPAAVAAAGDGGQN